MWKDWCDKLLYLHKHSKTTDFENLYKIHGQHPLQKIGWK